MDLASIVARRVMVPLYDWRDGLRAEGTYRHLLDTQFLPGERIREMQWESVRDLLRHAAQHVPFYRARFADAGYRAEDVGDWESFSRLPLLTKDDVRNDLDGLIAEGLRRDDLFHKRTGGSTGTPVHLYWDLEARRFKAALTRRHDGWAGYVRGMKRAALWGDTEKKLNLRQRLRRFAAERTIYLDTLLMDDAHLSQFVEELRRFQPESLIGHGHSLFFLAEVLQERGIDDIHFQSIISTAEMLTAEERRLVERVFGPIVFDRYGCEEVSIIASECEEQDGLHIASEGLYVEVLGGSETTPGRVVLTDLVNRAMPLIRYEVGDLATLRSEPCACGRGLPRLGRVMGRTSDILKTPDGRSISGISILDTFMIHIPGVRQAQIIQEKIDELRILVLKDSRYSDQTPKRLGEVVREVFGETMQWSLEIVDEIPRTARGKYEFTISNLGGS